MRNVLGAVVCLLAPSAFAEKLCVTPFKGPGGDTVRSQIADNLCVSNACVAPAKVTKGGKPDFAKGKKEKVDFFVTGTVKAKGAKHTLDLLVQAKPGAPKLKKSWTFTGNALPDKMLEQVLAALTKAMGLEAAEPEPEPKKEEKKEEVKPAEPKKEKEEEKPAEPEKKEDEPPPTKKKKDAEPPPPPKEDERTKEADDEGPKAKPVKPPFLAAEVGLDLFSRSFSYNDPQTTNLRSYSAGLIVAPAFRVELYPLALFMKGFITGLGVDATFALAVGLKSRRSGTDVTWPTSLQRYDVSLRFRIRPLDSVDAAIIPFVGYSNRSFSVGKGTDDSTLDGLPNVSYSAIRPGIAGELPFSNSGFLIFAKFAVQIVLSSGQIINPTGFFHKGSNFGIEGQLGAGYRLFGPVSIRLAFDFIRYGLGFTTEATDEYRAGGAVDLYLGGNVAVRLTF